jgi:hypothetical protein
LKSVAFAFILGALAAVGHAQTAAPPETMGSLPDILGIRPGMPAQQAYELLKAHGPKDKIVVGEFPIRGVSEKPVPTAMAVTFQGANPPEFVVLLLTPPPGKQVVWSMSRTFEIDKNKPLLASNVVAGLRQKYGPEVDERTHYWAFDEKGRRDESAGPKGSNCGGSINRPAVASADSTVTQVVSYLATIPLPASNPCNSFVDIRAVFNGPSPEYVFHIDVELTDWALGVRAQQAYQAFVANADAARQKDDIEKAKKRDGPVF